MIKLVTLTRIGRTPAAMDSACHGERLQPEARASGSPESHENRVSLRSSHDVSRERTPTNIVDTAGSIPGRLRLRLIFPAAEVRQGLFKLVGNLAVRDCQASD